METKMMRDQIMILMSFLQWHNPLQRGSIKPEGTHRERLKVFVFPFFSSFLSSVHLAFL